MTNNRDLPLLDRVRQATWHRHQTFENLPFVTALTAGKLPLESYIGQLRGLAVVLATLEQVFAASRDPFVATIRPLLLSRFELLCRDLRYFSSRMVPDIVPAVKVSLELAAMVRSQAQESVNSLVGYLYVLEGTTRGNRVHLPDIVRCFNLSGDDGVTFYWGYGEATESHWEEFRQTINAALNLDPDAVLEAAEAMYSGLERFHQFLYPVSPSGLGLTATSLNPEAGDHPVPQQRFLLEAALRAGERCWERYPYYRKRYGDRGRRFTDSDVAWLTSLVTQPAAVVSDQVLWLARVLAVRGMPRLLMETQLELLVDEIRKEGANVSTSALESALDTLRNERQHSLTQEEVGVLLADLQPLLAPAREELPDLPHLIVAALSDEILGIPECLESICCWLSSAKILPDQCISELLKFLAVKRKYLFQIPTVR